MKLTVAGARIAIVVFSLGITGVLLTFLILAPALGMPFNPGRNENIRLIEIIVPVFFGYLGSAAHFVFHSQRGREMLLEGALYGPTQEIESNAVEVYVHRLRRHLIEVGASVQVHTVRGVGYMISDGNLAGPTEA